MLDLKLAACKEDVGRFYAFFSLATNLHDITP